MKTENISRAAAMLLMMLLMTTTAWATDLTDFLPVSSSGTATGYFAFSNHFYRVDWSGINTSQTSSVKLDYIGTSGSLVAERNGDTTGYTSLYGSASRTSWETSDIIGLTPGQSSDGYTSYANLATGAQSQSNPPTYKKVCTVTCMTANAPTWNWSADYTTCTATFTCTDYPSLTTTVNATVTTSGSTVTASVTFNGTNYSNSKNNPTYSINYVLNGGTNAAGNPSTYTAGTGVASLASPTRTGYTFGGWYDNPGFSGSAVTSIPASTMGAVTLYAKWTANQYTVVYNANGGSGTMSNQTFTYDVAQQLQTNTFTYTGMLFDGWKDGNNNSYTANQSVSNLTATNNGTVTLYAQWKEDPTYIAGSGTESDPYIISSKGKWDTFANESNYATYWGNGTHIQLGANISGVTTMVGTNNHRFCGTFDGQGYTLSVSYSTDEGHCAPLRYTDGATIKKLNVEGTITTSSGYAAGLIGLADGTTNVSDCRSSIIINSSKQGFSCHAGFIAVADNGSTTNISGCVFDGSINFTGSGSPSNSCGGFMGRKNSPIESPSTVNISNCLLAATFDIDANGCNTFCGGNNVHIENSYYITALGTVQGTQAYIARQSFTSKSATILSTTVYYAADLTPFGKTNSYTPDGSADHPYVISDADGWEYFCDALADNDTWNRFSGKTVKLGANIGTAQDPITRWAGSSGHDFCGTFDGDGKTLTIKYGADGAPASVQNVAPFSYVSNTTPIGSPANEDYTAPFRYVNGATIEHLHVGGTIYTQHTHAGGIVGLAYGSTTITDCHSSVNIVSSINGDGTHGGIMACTWTGSTTEISGCLFDGKLLTTGGTTNCGGFVGWRNSTLTISNSLYAPATITTGETEISDNSYTFSRQSATVTNSFYTRTLGTEQGKLRHSITVGENVTVALSGTPTEYATSGITAYKNGDTQLPGIKYGGVLYAGSGDNVSLTLSNSVGSGYSYTVSAGTLSENTLTMPDADVVVSLGNNTNADWLTEYNGTEVDPYMIYNTDQLNLLAYRVNGTHGETANDFSGKYFKLGADITYTYTKAWNDATSTENNYEPIGGYYNNSNRYFRGNFDGDGHTISGIRIYKGGTGNGDTMNGIFGGTEGANIHDLTLADTRITGYTYVGGIAGKNASKHSNNVNIPSTIIRCHVAANVAICAAQTYTWYHGGIVGCNYGSSTVSQCTSAATLTTYNANDSYYYGGIAGYNEGTLTDNLVIGATVPAAPENYYGAIAGYQGTLQHNYYYNCNVAGVQNATGVGSQKADVTETTDHHDGVTYYNGALPGIILYDNSTKIDINSQILTTVNNATVPRVALSGRTLYKDGYWNTLCLPFDLVLEGSPFEGDNMKAMTLNTSESGLTGTTLTLNFTQATTIPAGTPFIIKWDSGDNLVNPVFSGVTVSNETTNNEQIFTGGKFVGAYSPVSFTANDMTKLFLGAANTLYWPNANMTVNACRAYFQLSDPNAEVREFRLNFRDGEASGISTTNFTNHTNSDEWYSLDGRKLDGKPTKAGLYIYGGNKVAIK